MSTPQPPNEPPGGGWQPPAGGGYQQPAGGGYQPMPDPGPQPPAQRRTPGKATASLVLGIVGIFICPLVCSVLAIVFGVQAKREIDANPYLGGRGLAQAGFILGIIGLATAVIWFLVVVGG